MFCRVIVVVICLLSVSGLPANSAQEAASKIEANVTAYHTTDRGVVYRVTYSYQFSRRENVYVDGLGSVPSKGTFSYFSDDSDLKFREAEHGRTLATISLLDAGVYAATSREAEFPEESKVGSAYRSRMLPILTLRSCTSH